MNALPNILTEGKRLTAMSWQELVGVAKVNPTLAPILLHKIEQEAKDKREPEWADAARYALDADDFSELDWLIEQPEYPYDELERAHGMEERICPAIYGSFRGAA